MNSGTFTIYRHSGKFQLQGPLLAICAAAAVGLPAGFIYGYFMRWIPFYHLNVLATIGYAILFAGLSTWFMKRFAVRNNAVVVVTGLLVGVLALYLAWNGHMNAVFDDKPLFCGPQAMLNRMRILYEQGTWSLHEGDAPLTGGALGLVWLVEGGLIVGFSTFVPYRTIANMPFCEESQCWLDQVKEIDTLQAYTDPADRAALKAGDLSPLTRAKPKEKGAISWTRITLKHSPNCEIFHTLRLQTALLTFNRKGKSKLKFTSLTRDLVLPADMLELISRFEQWDRPPEMAVETGSETQETASSKPLEAGSS